jgi:serine/threonine protein kinase
MAQNLMVDGEHSPSSIVPKFPEHFSESAKSFIAELLDVNDKTRLGSGPTGAKDVKSHVFFQSIIWDLLEQRHVEPPSKPLVEKSLDAKAQTPHVSFQAMMVANKKGKWMDEPMGEEMQKYFKNW